MSNTHCRFCQITVKGLYLNCPKCGKYLAPGRGVDIPPEDYEVVTDYTYELAPIAPKAKGKDKA